MREELEEIAEERGCRLNPDEEVLKKIIAGLKNNEEKTGRRYCLCKIGVECPCDFMNSITWKEKGMCDCNLFVK